MLAENVRLLNSPVEPFRKVFCDEPGGFLTSLGRDIETRCCMLEVVSGGTVFLDQPIDFAVVARREVCTITQVIHSAAPLLPQPVSDLPLRHTPKSRQV